MKKWNVPTLEEVEFSETKNGQNILKKVDEWYTDEQGRYYTVSNPTHS